MILHGDCLEKLRSLPDSSVDAIVTDPPAGISFMGKDWDSDKGGSKEWIAWMASVMRECLRVMKPGAHGLVWAIPRTSHWTATALEDAGFEIRDVVTHLFGQGFPKSLSIDKAIDKAAGAEREVVGQKGGRYAYAKQDFRGGEFHAESDKTKTAIFGAVTAPATDAAKQWAGWGTALKPASEHWILVRKPCSEKNVAANVLKWGTGGINVGGCRVNPGEAVPGGGKSKRGNGYNYNEGEAPENAQPHTQGRFPATLILDEEAARMLDEQTGLEVAKFFYCAKVSPSERGEENKHPTVKPLKLMRYLCRLITPPGGLVLDPFAGSGSTGVAALQEGFRFVGIEQDASYVEIATRRMEAACP